MSRLTPSFLSLPNAPWRNSMDTSSFSSSHCMTKGSNHLQNKICLLPRRTSFACDRQLCCSVWGWFRIRDLFQFCSFIERLYFIKCILLTFSLFFFALPSLVPNTLWVSPSYSRFRFLLTVNLWCWVSRCTISPRHNSFPLSYADPEICRLYLQLLKYTLWSTCLGFCD